MKVLLLGKDGQVGRALAPVLAPLGEIVALGRQEADFERPGELPRLVAEHAPDAIVNAAAYTAVDKAESDADRARLVNVEAVAALAGAAERRGIWLIHYSTDYVFDGRKPEPYDESDAPNPLSVYGATKSRGDLAIAQAGCRHLIFRVSWVFGDGDRHFAASMLRLARERESLSVVADQIGAPTSARLIAEVTAEALSRLGTDAELPVGSYHLAAMGSVSRADYARFVIAEAIAQGARFALAPEAVADVKTADYPTPAARPLNSRLATDKLAAVLGRGLPPWQEDVRRWLENRAGRGEA
jgi:dTDP-4-dehydrorhamnose reductase